jgi:DNA-binding Lrp family transcriptional regulator
MKKVKSFLMVWLLILLVNVSYAQCPTIDIVGLAQSKLTTFATEKIAGFAQLQLAEAKKQLDEALKLNKITEAQYDIVKEYQNYLVTPNINFVGGVYKSPEDLYQRIRVLTNGGVMNQFTTAIKSKLGSEADGYVTAVGLFISEARNKTEDIKKLLDKLKEKKELTMNDSERMYWVRTYEKDFGVMISAIKLYYSRMKKILSSKKGVQSSSWGFISRLIS